MDELKETHLRQLSDENENHEKALTLARQKFDRQMNKIEA